MTGRLRLLIRLLALLPARLRVLLALPIALLPAEVSAAVPADQTFAAGSLATITARHCGKGPFALALWSIDCAHCKNGLQALERLRRQNATVRVVLIQADVAPPPEAGPAMLRRAGVIGSERWVFADEAPERLRYAIDPDWAGELPRTYLYNAACERVGVSGALPAKTLQRWLRRGEKS